MKLADINVMENFFNTIDQCEGKVELIIENQARLNLKSTLSQFVSMVYLMNHSNSSGIEIVTTCSADREKMMRFIA